MFLLVRGTRKRRRSVFVTVLICINIMAVAISHIGRCNHPHPLTVAGFHMHSATQTMSEMLSADSRGVIEDAEETKKDVSWL
jgi:hypothetical protein